MKRIYTIFFAILALTFPLTARAEGWVWMDFYPWVWSNDEQSWLYMWPAGDSGFTIWIDTAQQMGTIGSIPVVSAQPQGHGIALTPEAVAPGAPTSTVASVSILNSKSDLATVMLVEAGNSVDCTWSLASVSAVGKLYIIRSLDGTSSYTLYLNYTTDTTGTYVLNEPAPDGWSSNVGAPIYRGTFEVVDL